MPKEVYLTAPLSRGNIDAQPGETVHVPDGLAGRLVDRGRAVWPSEVPVENATAKPAAKAPAKSKAKAKAPADPE